MFSFITLKAFFFFWDSFFLCSSSGPLVSLPLPPEGRRGLQTCANANTHYLPCSIHCNNSSTKAPRVSPGHCRNRSLLSSIPSQSLWHLTVVASHLPSPQPLKPVRISCCFPDKTKSWGPWRLGPCFTLPPESSNALSPFQLALCPLPQEPSCPCSEAFLPALPQLCWAASAHTSLS